MFDLIKKMRIKNGLSQKDVADYLGISLNQYRKNENEPHHFLSIHMLRLSPLFNCSISELYKYEENKFIYNNNPEYANFPSLEYEENFDDLIDENGNITIYKYRSFDQYIPDNILENRFFMPYVKDVNDPFEGISYFSKNKINSVMYAKFDTLAVGSFSLINNNPVMWTHYSEEYTGVCFEISVNIKELREKGYIIGRVKYPDKINFSSINSTDEVTLKRIYQDHSIVNSIFRKNRYWSFEEEIRIIKQIKHSILMDNTTALYHSNGNVGKAINPINYLEPFKITKIIIGKNISKINLTKLMSWTKRKRIPLYCTYIDLHNYEIKIEKR